MSIQCHCPSCSFKNTLSKTSALNLVKNPTCKKCATELFPHFEKPFSKIDAKTFEHNLDKQMLDTLKKIPGIDTLLRAMIRHSFELAMRLHHQGNFIRVDKKQLKSLYLKLVFAAEALDINEIPEFYVYNDPKANAYTFGVHKYCIAISSGALQILSDDEIKFVLGHELGHIKSNHVLYKTASRILSLIAANVAQKTLGLGGVMLYPLQAALTRWDRASELSSDRAGLLVVRNPTTALKTMMKLASGSQNLAKELDIKSFINQAEAYEKTQEEGPLGRYIDIMNTIFVTHPYPIWRAKEILEWVNSGKFFNVLAGEYVKENQENEKKCEVCGKSYNLIFKACPTCEEKQEKMGPKDAVDKTLSSIKEWYDKNFTN